MRKFIVGIFIISNLILLSCSSPTDNVNDNIKFIQTYEYFSSKGFSLDLTNDKGYIITGYYNSGNIMLLKTDKNGNEQWCKTVGEASEAWGYCVLQTKDDGYIVAGNLTEDSLYVVKTDINGDNEWSLTIDGGFAYTVIQTIDDGYLISGRLNNQACLIKINQYGFEDWTRTFQYSNAHSVIQADEGGFVFISGSRIVRTDELGYEIWNNSISGGFGTSMKQTDDGGYIIAGRVSQEYDIWLVKTDALGNRIWERSYDGNLNYDEYQSSVDITDDGGYIVVATKRNIIDNFRQIWLIKTNEIGIEEWNTTFGGIEENDYSVGQCVRQTADGGYILTGQINYHVCLVKTDDEGNVE
ncbi:MAG: hypothetical protein HOG24_05265 [Candidatus Cloacimonetes bacterium]|jgi:hypothetical protein|nr:hypothetical protein [Candidatus Cloacimonadota bacterium]